MAEIANIQSVMNQKVEDVQITRLTAPGENFLSLVYRVDYVDENGTNKSAVAKKLPTSRDAHMDNFLTQAMKNEIKWYRDMMPFLKKLGQELEIDCSFYPDYVGSRLSLDGNSDVVDDDSVLILDNLIPIGYINEDRYKGFDLPSAKAMLRMLVHFHALPLAIKFHKPREFKVIKDYLESAKPPGPQPKPPGEEKGKQEGKGPGASDRIIFDKLMEMPEAEAYKPNIIELKKRPMIFPGMIECGEEPWLTNSHGDFWVNNVMLKPTEGEPQVKMIDFQVCGYSSYVRDLVFFLLTSVEDEVQKEHFDQLLRFYYDELTSIFKRLKIAELELTYEQFLNDVKDVANKSEVVHALFFCSVIFGPKDNVKDVLTGEGDLKEHMEFVVNNLGERHKQKVLLIIQLAVERGWI